MTASGDRPARGFIQLFRPGLLVLLEALKVSFCHSSHRPPPLLCHFLLSVQQADGTNATILPTSSCFVVVHFCDILFSSVISPQIQEICASLLLLFIPCFFVMLFPHATSLFPFPVSSFSSAISSNRVWPASSFFASFSDGRAQRASAFRHLRLLPMGAADCCPETFMWPFVSAVQGRGVGASDCPSERQRNANCLDNSLLSCYVSVSVSVGWAVLSGGFPLVSPLSSCSFSAG